MSKHEPDDPIGDYVEWTEHRYDPGHYLGGNVSPFLRKSRRSPRVRRLAALPLGVSAIFATIGAFQAAQAPELSRLVWFLSAAGAILLWWVALAMFRSGRLADHSHHRHRH